MIILVAVTVTMAVNGGLFSKAQTAGIKTNEAVALEQELGNGKINIAGQEYNSPQEYVDTITGGETTSPYIGCYACVEGQYGVIYADLAYSKSGEWGGSNGAYLYEAEDPEKLKKYYQRETYDPGDEYGTAWGEQPVLVADKELNETEERTIDRFYVMALTDYTTEDYTTFSWNRNVEENYARFGTSTEFGTGKENTELLVNTTEVKWADRDIWNNLPSSSVWFVPSRAEWSAFAQEIGITSSTYSSYGLSIYYWSSSQSYSNLAPFAYFSHGYMADCGVDADDYVRLCTTF